MADRDDAMDVGAIEDDALNDDDEQDENGDEVEELSLIHISEPTRP